MKPSVLAKNSRYSFYLHRPRPDAEWVVKEWGSNDKIDKKSHLAKFEDTSVATLCPHFRIYNVALADFLADAAFVLKEANFVGGGAKGLARISFTHREVPSKKLQPRDGWMLLDSDAYWCVREYELKISGPGYTGQEKATNQYELDQNGFPLPTRHVLVESSSSQTDPKFELVREIKLAPHNGLSEADFSLTAFGLPEPAGIGVIQVSGSRRHIWLAASALICLVLVVVSLRAKRYYAQKRAARLSGAGGR
jgi:hypothetical protein